MTAKIIWICVLVFWIGLGIFRCVKKKHSIVSEVYTDFYVSLIIFLFLITK
ncbi:hypothetical protein Ethha_2438 [Ethanoligenens harbinense YUAN-3]|uniref:Uncharacterized protein n=1 Tax=Ethanoligenens harbinense (strain DSM 18485 / JCM 12961 / CGMCC 1.5033 / YUAN-3) TaxID=663278 RepID=E6U5C0_ETHHY|nr:hypothetical protein Ethha_2438 [Ethanoligenens harbinense YUAN-3]